MRFPESKYSIGDWVKLEDGRILKIKEIELTAQPGSFYEYYTLDTCENIRKSVSHIKCKVEIKEL